MNITSYTVEKLTDPFGILTGDRYEFFIDLEIDPEDELYAEAGTYARVLYLVDGDRQSMLKYDLYHQGVEAALDFDLEEEEEQQLAAFCSEHLHIEE